MARATKISSESLWKPRPWDLLTLAIAFAALLVAVIAYFNSGSAIPEDNLDVVMTGDPDVTFKKPRYIPSAEQTVVLTNSGSRSATLISLELVVVNAMEDGTDCDNFAEKTLGAIFVPYDLEPVAIPAGEAVTRKVRLRKAANKLEGLEPMFPDNKKELRIIACYRFIAAVSGSREVTLIEAGTWVFDRNGPVSSELTDMSEPHALLSE